MFNFFKTKPKEESYWDIVEREAQEDFEAIVELQSMKVESDKAVADHKTDKPAFIIEATRDGQFLPKKLVMSTNLYPHDPYWLRTIRPRHKVKTADPYKVNEQYVCIDSPLPTKEDAAQSIVNYTNAGNIVAEYDYPPLKPRT